MVLNGIISKVQSTCIIVELPLFCQGIVALPDVSDVYKMDVFRQFKEGQFEKCYVLHYDPEKKHRVALSFRKSRYEKYIFCI